MQEFWIRLKVRDNGTLEECKYFSRLSATEKLLGRKEVLRKDDFFTPIADEPKDVLAVKRAVAAFGGVVGLAYKLDVTRPAIYQWIYRKKIPKNYRQTVYDLAGMYTEEFEAKYFVGESWEKILDE